MDKEINITAVSQNDFTEKLLSLICLLDKDEEEKGQHIVLNITLITKDEVEENG